MSNQKFGQGGLGRRLVLVLWFGFCWVLIMSIGSTCNAAEWAFVPSMGIKGYYNSNLIMTPLPHEPTYGYWVSPGAEFAGKTERLEVSGRAALDYVDYYGGEQTQFTNINFPLSVRYKTETDEFGFTGGFTRDNTLMGELQTTGLVLRFTQRNLWTANPTWTRNLTENLAFQGALQFSDASYQDGLRIGLTDYQLFGGSAGFLYRLSENDEVQLTGSYTNFHTLSGPSDLRANYPGATISYTHAFTETLRGTAYGGPRFIGSTARASADGQETVWIYGVSLSKDFERFSVQANLTRDILPSGFGVLVKTDRAGISTAYKMSENIIASFETFGYVVSPTSTVGRTFSENQFLYITPKISWKFFEWWKLEASYTYRLRDTADFMEPVISNITTLMLTYYPPKLAISQ